VFPIRNQLPSAHHLFQSMLMKRFHKKAKRQYMVNGIPNMYALKAHLATLSLLKMALLLPGISLLNLMTSPGTYSTSSRSYSRICVIWVKSWIVFSSASSKSSLIVSTRLSSSCLSKPSQIGLNGLSSLFCYSSCFLLSSSYFCFSSYLFFSAYFFFSSYYFLIFSIFFCKSAILAASLSSSVENLLASLLSSENLLASVPTLRID